MLKRHSKFFENLMLIGDLIVVGGMWLFAYYLRFYAGPIPVYKGIPPFEAYLLLLAAIIPIWAVAFKTFGLYRPRRISSRLREVLDIAKASTFSILVLATVTFFFRQFEFSRLVFLYFWVLSIVAVSFMRGAFRELLRYFRRKGYNLRYALVVGAGRIAQDLVDKLTSHPELGLRLVGLLSEDPELVGRKLSGLKVLGTYQDVRRIVKEGGIDQVFIAVPFESHQKVEGILKDLGDEPLDVKVIPDFQQQTTLRGGIEDFEGLPIISLQDSPLYGWNLVFKRAFDLTFSTLALLLVAPLMLAVAVLIRLTSHGLIFYRQERMGLDGRVFTMVKFRTMRAEAEEESGPVWAVKGDPRRTRLGAFLRRTSIDELPQLMNVFKGEMSLVGPRPERPIFIEEFRKQIPRYMLRHKMKAGMTGWAQVNGWRGNTSLEKRIEYDLYYIEHWSLLFDLKILWLTLWKGLVDKNAY